MISPTVIVIVIFVVPVLIAFLALYRSTHMKVVCYDCQKTFREQETTFIRVKGFESGPGSDDVDNYQPVCFDCEKKRTAQR